MNKIAVIGLGRFGSTVAVALARKGVEVLAVDRRSPLFEAVADDDGAEEEPNEGS